MMTSVSEKYKPTSSLEDYLEAIVMLKEQGEKATVTALSESVGVRKPSVEWALKKLGDAGLVVHEKYGDIDLTSEGARIAKEVYRRHKIIRQFLVEILNLAPETAENDACRIEHVLSRDGISRLEKFIDFVLNCPRGNPEWLAGFNYYVKHGERDKNLLMKCQRENNI